MRKDFLIERCGVVFGVVLYNAFQAEHAAKCHYEDAYGVYECRLEGYNQGAFNWQRGTHGAMAKEPTMDKLDEARTISDAAYIAWKNAQENREFLMRSFH